MKEVCERTGLTDRAVRLYIDNGLLRPAEESSYTGRKSIHFSEEDVVALEAIAALRKADFSIVDIRDMQTEPERISTILDAHKKKLATDIENKQQILKSLSAIDNGALPDYFGVAEQIRQSASRNHLPKEDSSMHFKDFQKVIKNRIFSVMAFAVLLLGMVTLTPLLIQAAFADEQILVGGGYTHIYDFTWERFFRHIQLFAAGLCMAAAIVLLFVHIIKGKRNLVLGGGILCVLSIAVLLLLPAEIRETLNFKEFLSYRYSFLYHIFGYSGAPGLRVFLVQCLKFICPVTAAVLSFIGFFRQKDLSPEDLQ